jgi:hypothetical protein
MRVGTARTIAAEWVARHARGDAAFRGAFFSGSTLSLPSEAELPRTSDVDVVVLTTANDTPPKLGKLRYRDVLLEVTFAPWHEYVPVEHVLGSYHLAGSFRVDALRTLHTRVAQDFADRRWVRRRCEDARRRVEERLRAIDPAAPEHQQVMAWLFPTGVTTHVLLVSAMRNPTVRLRYLKARQVLAEYGLFAVYPDLLELLGCESWSRSRTEQHMRMLERTFDATVHVARTPFFFSGDITAAARPIAIDGSWRLIDDGNHREAVFWIIATFARCHTILAIDAPERHEALLPALRDALADLGINGAADIPRRADRTLRYLPRLWQTTETIMAANPGITN